MDYIRGISFTGARHGKVSEAKESLELMKEKTGCNTVILVIGALQETAHSEKIDYKHSFMPKDEELKEIIQYSQQIGLRVILKPFLNCKDGTWRAYINFFDKDVVCEPKWSNWFQSYTDYQMHYAKIANETSCEMLVIGCEMVMSERREMEWRKLIEEIRTVYHGLITYNTDKYQEDNLTWWDALDVISSSGYYPIHDWDNQLARIEAVVKKYNKPFFFGEAGCKSCTGASKVPNDWTIQGDISHAEQEQYYRMMFDKCRDRNFVHGFGFWDWHSKLYKEADGLRDRGYALYGKAACELIFQEWK